MNKSARINPLAAPELSALPGIRHGFFTRQGGTSTGIYAGLNCGLGSDDDTGAVTENRRRVSAFLTGGQGAALNTLYQVHGTRTVVFPGAADGGRPPKADGAVTGRPGEILAILTADCAPVLFADPDRRVVAACHAGWRGAFDGIIESTIMAMEKKGADRTHIRAAIGPCIAQQSYQVGPEFFDRFTESDPENEIYFRPDDDGRHRFDLLGFVLSRLIGAGIAGASAIDADTCADETLFFSYRRSTLRGEPDYGRMVSAIMLEDDC